MDYINMMFRGRTPACSDRHWLTLADSAHPIERPSTTRACIAKRIAEANVKLTGRCATCQEPVDDHAKTREGLITSCPRKVGA